MDLWEISKLSSVAKCLLITPVSLGGRKLPLCLSRWAKKGGLPWSSTRLLPLTYLMVWSGPWVLVRGVKKTGRGHSTGRVGQAPETRIRRVIGRKKCKCVQVKLIELGLCLEIAMDTLESFLSPVESPLWAPTLSSLHITLRDSSEVEVDENKKFFFLFC